MEGMFTMASTAVKNLLLEEQFPPGAVRRGREARNVPCFKMFIQKEDNSPQAITDLATECIGLPSHFLHHTEPSEEQSKIPMRDKLAQLYCYKELLSSNFCS